MPDPIDEQPRLLRRTTAWLGGIAAVLVAAVGVKEAWYRLVPSSPTQSGFEQPQGNGATPAVPTAKSDLEPPQGNGTSAPDSVNTKGLDTHAFALGVHMAFASYKSILAKSDPSWCAKAADELSAAALDVTAISSASPSAKLTRSQEGVACPPYESILSDRKTYAASLRNGPPDLSDWYDLGLNIGVAEIQATAGDAARQVVISSLINARAQITALQLAPTPLDDALTLATTNSPMTAVHDKVFAARITYQPAQ